MALIFRQRPGATGLIWILLGFAATATPPAGAQQSQISLTASGSAVELQGANGIEAPQDSHEFVSTSGPDLLILHSVSAACSLSTGGYMNSTAAGAIGVLRASAFTFEVYGTDSHGNLVANGYVAGAGKAEFVDTILISNPSLANGQPVSYTATFEVSGSHSVPDRSQDEGLYSAIAVANLSLEDGFNTANAPRWYSPDHTEQSIRMVVTLDTFIGRTLTLRASLETDTYINAVTQTARTASSDYTSDGAVTLSVSEPGTNLVGVSGHNFAAACPGDLNQDRQVDDSDFVIFVNAYDILDCSDPAMPSGCPANLDGDGDVDDADFVVFVTAYNALLCS